MPLFARVLGPEMGAFILIVFAIGITSWMQAARIGDRAEGLADEARVRAADDGRVVEVAVPDARLQAVLPAPVRWMRQVHGVAVHGADEWLPAGTEPPRGQC